MGAIESIFSEIDVSDKEKEDLHFMSLATKLQGQFLSRLEIILLLRLLCLFRLLSLNTARIRRARLVLSIKVVISLSGDERLSGLYSDTRTDLNALKVIVCIGVNF